MDIGFLGLGNMGAAMAANLLRAGHAVTGYNRTFDKVEALVADGALPARTVAEACRGDVVVSMLANDDAVEAVAFGADGLLANLGEGSVHVSCSTISVALAQRLIAAHADAGQRFVAAPVFGRPEAHEPRSCSSSRPGIRLPCRRPSPCSTPSANARSSSPSTQTRPAWSN
jgi:3-hydroxyisobutyrate dehydrogenase-like beta-hydroxyacid dehydrogenase